MRKIPWVLAALLAIATSAAAQDPRQEGFFRRAADPALNAPLPPSESSLVTEPAAVASEVERATLALTQARESLERELDRSRNEHQRAHGEAMRQPLPMIVSPLDGTAPIVSPLDGTAPIVSPIGR